jgi:acetyl esterase/lipase
MNELPINESLVSGSAKLFIFFGGIAGALGMPPFEFYRSANVLEYSKIFLRDPRQAWYQRGLPGLGNDALAVGRYLELKISESGASDVRFVGNSMGGFAALLFCAMLRHGRAVAFAPQTFISGDKRARHGDTRWADQISSLHQNASDHDILELQSWIDERFPNMPATVLVSTSDRLDLRHAEELLLFPNVTVHRFAGAGHDLVARLRDEGKLIDILNS